MRSPTVIGFLSFLPGLGFLVLRQNRQALVTVGIIVGLLLIPFLAAQRFFDECEGLTIVVWAVQIVLAWQAALRTREENLEAPKASPIVFWLIGITLCIGLIALHILAGWAVGNTVSSVYYKSIT
jgi:hypothetical protein